MSKIATLLLLLLGALPAIAAQPAGTACTEPRVRKPWELLSDAEKTRYINAVKLAMQKGYHLKFVELHTEYWSELEAHQTCVFMYWHRMFLLGYENMLRSLGDDYKCVTIPYWDHLSATARMASGVCSTIENCSPIYRDFGGSSIGSSTTYSVTVLNVTIPRTWGGVCATGSMLSSFCGSTRTCARCMVRGLAYRRPYPAEAFFTSVYQQMFTYDNWLDYATSIERGVHNMVHSALGGVMTWLQSPADPIFYTHHGFIDALQTIYVKCQLGDENALLSADQKGSDERFWNSCPRRSSGTFLNTDTITMNTLSTSQQWVDVRTNPTNTLYAFFKDLPGRFSDYVDAKDLGVYSYTYALQGALTNMYTNCKDSNTITAATVKLLADERGTSTVLKPTTRAPNEFDTKMRRWTIAIYESAKLAGYTDSAARDQMEMILCVHKRQCLGGVEDYDPVFRKNFCATGHPRCYTILQQIDAGDRVIGIPKWDETTQAFLPCKAESVSFEAEKQALEL